MGQEREYLLGKQRVMPLLAFQSCALRPHVLPQGRSVPAAVTVRVHRMTALSQQYDCSDSILLVGDVRLSSLLVVFGLPMGPKIAGDPAARRQLQSLPTNLLRLNW